MTIFQLNERKGHKFLMSGAMFGFCMSRALTNALRLALATRPKNVRLEIAALIFTNAGVLALYIVVLLLVLRVFRATHPKLGWNGPFKRILTVAYCVLVCALLLVIAFSVLTFYTLNPTLRSVALWIERGALLYMLMFNVMSLVMLLLSSLLPRAPDNENFGTGSMSSKLTILAVAVFFALFIAGFHTRTTWAAPRSIANPAWFDSKAAFYVIVFGFEIIVVYMFIFTRFDRRFWVPNGSKQPGDYSSLSLDDSTAIRMSELDKTSEQDKASRLDNSSLEDRASVQSNV